MFQKLYYIFNQNHKKIVTDLKNRNEFLEKENYQLTLQLAEANDKNREMRKEIKDTKERGEILYHKYCRINEYVQKEKARVLDDARSIQGDIDQLEIILTKNEKQDLKVAHNHKKYLLVNRG